MCRGEGKAHGSGAQLSVIGRETYFFKGVPSFFFAKLKICDIQMVRSYLSIHIHSSTPFEL